ncbi:MAG: SpoIIE family protein phosphatase, partial [Oscillospiraceae bacterium]
MYLGTSTDAAFSILEVVISSVLLFVIPRSIFDISRNITDFGGKDTEATIKVQDYVKDRLLDVSDSFRTLAETFISISDRKNNMDMSDIGTMFDTAADRVCRNCRHANECWEKNFNSTYKTMFKFLEIMEQNGHLELSDVDPHFSEKCVKIRTLIEEINRLFEIYKINQVWKNKLAENRELIGEQFNGVADIIEGISNEVSTEITFNSTIAKTISDKLSAKGIDVENIDVLQNQNGIYIVDMSVCATDECRACSVIRPILKSVLGVCMISPHMTCVNNGEFCNVRFNQVEGYDVNVGFAQGQMESDCGDNHVFNYLGNGKYVITLSDGMGTGRRASRDSETIVELLGDFMNAGFDKTVAVKLVNSIMVMKSADEAFATVDMCVIDLFTGEVEFIKNGAEPSFIKKDDTAEVVRATSLPVGMVSTVDIETFTRCVTIGDMIVMATDGIQTKDGNKGWLKDTIATADTKMPAQELADRVLEKAIALKGGEPDDD